MASKKSSDESLPVKVGEIPAALVQLMTSKADDSLETLRHHRVLNRIAVMHEMTKKDVRAKFGPPGTVVIPATETVIGPKEQPMVVVPVFFFDEFIIWNDRNDLASEKIVDRSLDPGSPIAVRAGDPKRRVEKYGNDGKGGQFSRTWRHHLNFVVVFYDGALKGQHAILSFSKGIFRDGMTWISKIQARRIPVKNSAGVTVPICPPLWSQVWQLTVADRNNEKGEWYGFDMNPSPDHGLVIEDDAVEPLQTLHRDLKDNWKQKLLVVAHEAAEEAQEGESFSESKEM